MKTDEFKSLLVDQLVDVYCIEKASQRILPKLKKASQDQILQDTLEAQLITTSSNLEHIETASKSLEVDVTEYNCSDLKIIVDKAENYINDGPVNDAGILSQMERINNYKTAIYNSAVRFASALNYTSLSKELQYLNNVTYNMIDRLARINDNQADERAINNF